MSLRGVSQLLCLLLVACTPIQSSKSPSAPTLTIAAASSLSEAFQDLKTAFEAESETNLKLNFAASGSLQRQIEQGAPIDIFASAAEQPMKTLQQQSLIHNGTYKFFARNQLVIIAPKATVWISQGADLADSRLQRLAIGNPATVPAGSYAQKALGNLYPRLKAQQKLIPAENVRQVLTYVEQRHVDAGIVYASDVDKRRTVRVVAKIPASATGAILYPIAVLKQSQHPQQAKAFIQFVLSDQGQAILQQHGFLQP